jgi:4-alpha-glucanotransferase
MIKNELKENLFNTPSADKWRRVRTHRRAGILVGQFSIYSKNSLGIADFSDLKLLIDWANVTGNSIVQLLPMNEMGYLFCPYDSLSSFALEPVYIHLEKEIKNLRKDFPVGKPYVNYAIKKEKLNLLWKIYQREKERNIDKFKEFQDVNAYWLLDFALYKVIKDHQDGCAWYEWPDKFKHRQILALEDFQKEHKEEINFQFWLQWQVYEQFKDVKKYAESKKVLLKGDLPMLVSRDSADVWVHPEFFKLEFAAGAPPDMYCAKGQRWGMPTYNWEKIEQDNFRYLKEKLKYAQNFYDLLRIDHAVGLFRIWSIPYNEPLENKGLKGFFDPGDENTWGEHGRKILMTMLDNTDMLLCAEDLGVIPKVCTDTLKELGIPGNDVQRWVKDWKIKHDFLEPKEYRGLSVAMLSTHDTTNWPAWWENEAGTVDEGLFIRKCNERGIDFFQVKDRLFDPILSCHSRLRWLNNIDSVDKFVRILGKRKEEVMDFIEIYENTYLEKERLWRQLKLKGPMREKCDSEIVRAALKISLDSSAIFCINTLIDWLYLADIFKGDPYQYRINTPGTISDKNWSLTIPISLEELLRHKINKEIRSMIVSSSRI